MAQSKSKSTSSSKSASKPSAAQAPAAPETVSADQVGAAHGIAGALASVSKQEGDRTAEQKLKDLAKVSSKIDMSKFEGKTLTEMAVSGLEGLQAAFVLLVESLPRLYNIDFPHEASLAEVLSGEAADRGALSPDGESPHRVDDAVLPAGTNATDDMLPPNILTGDVPKGFEKHPGVVGAGSK